MRKAVTDAVREVEVGFAPVGTAEAEVEMQVEFEAKVQDEKGFGKRWES